jgi:hypothetical protein
LVGSCIGVFSIWSCAGFGAGAGDAQQFCDTFGEAKSFGQAANEVFIEHIATRQYIAVFLSIFKLPNI